MKRINTYITEKFKIKKGISIDNEKYYTVTLSESRKHLLSKNFIGKFDFALDTYYVHLFSISELAKEYDKNKIDLGRINAIEVPERLRDRIDDMKTGKFPITSAREYMGEKEELKIETIANLIDEYKEKKG